MTIGEAIHKMEFMRDGYRRLLAEAVRKGTILGEGVEGYWEADTPMNEIYKAHIEACQLSILALQQIEAEGWTTE